MMKKKKNKSIEELSQVSKFKQSIIPDAQISQIKGGIIITEDILP